MAFTEAHQGIGIVEKRHDYLRETYDKLRIKLLHIRLRGASTCTSARSMIHQVQIKEISPTIFMFGICPDIPGSRLCEPVFEDSNAIFAYTVLVTNVKERKLVNDVGKVESTPS